MVDPDVLVIGGGISGTSFAFHAARAGRRVLILEREPRIGGCLHSERTPDGFWFELGAHTAYNSYGAFLEVLEGCGLAGELQARAKPILRFLRGDEVVPGRNLGVLLRLFDKLELVCAVPRWLGRRRADQTVGERFARLVGPGNYARVLGPMVSAVPSQRADELPAEMLFKKRPRRADVLRSFTLSGGLQALPEAVLRQPRVEARLGRAAERIEQTGAGWGVTLDDGERIEAATLALATPPGACARLLAEVAPDLAQAAGEIGEVEVASLALALPADASPLPEATFLIPLEDRFHSIVTRDVVPDPRRRAFTLHFRPEVPAAERDARALAVLGVREEDVQARRERVSRLPAPRRGHAERVAAVDRALAGRRLAVTGNWFGGLSIEDCVLRARAEWRRVADLGGE